MAQEDDETARLYGAPLKFEPEFKGPRKRRSCTDIIFLILFIVFLAAWIVIGVYAFKFGSPSKLYNAVDTRGRRCGQDSEVLDKKYLFFFDLTKCATPSVLLKGCDTPQICVEQCPNHLWSSKPYRLGLKEFNLEDIQKNLICQDERAKRNVNSLERLKSSVSDGLCADWYIASTPLSNRCLPSHQDLSSAYQFLEDTGLPNALESISNSTLHISVDEFGGKVLDDLLKTWKIIIVCLVITVLVSVIYISLLRWIAGIMTWLSLVAVLALILTGVIYCVKRYIYLRDNEPPEVTSKMLQGQFEKLGNEKILWLVLSIVLGCILIISFLIIIFLRKRIVIAITLIKEGSKAIGDVLSALFFPIIPWILKFIVIFWVLVVAFHLTAVGNQVFKVRGLNDTCKCEGQYMNIKNGDICESQLFYDLCHSIKSPAQPCTSAGCHFYKMDSGDIITYFHLVNAFGFFWGLWFISGMSDMILAGTFAKWYWTFDKRRVPFFAITGSASRTVRYHLGTVALGSLIISICSFIRAIIEYVEKKVKAYENVVMKAFFCCLKCFFWCLEKFLRFINRNAYIMCSIHGRNFCMSAKDAFNLLMRNVVRVVVLDKVTDFLFFIGKLVITGGMVAATYYIMFQKNYLNLHFEGAVPLLIIAVGAYIIAATFFGVYSMAVDTLFLCFLEDGERNDGSIEKPYFMSKDLRQILGKKNRKQK